MPDNEKLKSCKWAKFDERLGEYKCTLFYIKLKPKKCEHCKNKCKPEVINDD